jgi:carbonic anhydrase/acetyltransferase-like protein (isoleucine patch superfamily)
MGLEPNTNGDFPTLATTAFVHETAVLVGAVEVKAGAFIGPQAVLRADEPGPDGRVAPICVAEEANIQDGVVIHALGGTGVRIGPCCSLAHGAIVHGPCELGTACFVGFNSVVFNARLGDNVLVMHQALVEGVAIPPGLLVPSSGLVRTAEDVQWLPRCGEEELAFADRVARTNAFLAQAARELRLRGASSTIGPT